MKTMVWLSRFIARAALLLGLLSIMTCGRVGSLPLLEDTGYLSHPFIKSVRCEPLAVKYGRAGAERIDGEVCCPVGGRLGR